jgi:hypothetical protein
MAFPPHKKTAKDDDLGRTWHPGDSIPAPEAEHRGTESGWALWNEVAQQHEKKFAPTAPMSNVGGMDTHDRAWAATQPAEAAAASGRRAGQPLISLDAAMLVARRNNRVCPRPARWAEFSALLPVRKTVRGKQPPPQPVTGGAWAVTPSLTKRLCFREQIEWAERAGNLEAVMGFMQSLSEQEWLHMGED